MEEGKLSIGEDGLMVILQREEGVMERGGQQVG